MKSVRELQLKGKRVLIRCDFNVPLDETGNIVDDFRIRQSIPTIEYALGQKAKIILLAHLGRPSPIFQIGQTQSPKSKIQNELSLSPIAKRLGELLGREVQFIADPIGRKVEKHTEAMRPGGIVLLENVRFYEGEKENDPAFARALAQLGDVYVNDAFAVSHRAHASLAGVPQYLPSAMGLLLEKEVSALTKIVQHPERPLLAIVGGMKIVTKSDFLDEMSVVADEVLTGNPVYQEIKREGLSFRGAKKIVGPLDGIPSKENALDIGPQTVARYLEKIKGAKTIFWTGPLGKIEEEAYARGSLRVARAIIESGAFSVVGGGDLVGFLHTHDLRERFSHVSTGGGAMLAFLSGQDLPGLKALEQSAKGTL